MPQGNTVKKLKAERTLKENHPDWESQIANKKQSVATFTMKGGYQWHLIGAYTKTCAVQHIFKVL